jgi:hypothetical protein
MSGGVANRGNALAFPNSARVILAAGDDGVALIIERARKNLVDVAFENLKTFSSINTPHATRLVAGCCNDAVALRIKLHLHEL